MEDLKFDFIRQHAPKENILEKKLKEIGQMFSQFENFYHLVSTTSREGKVKNATLWLMIPKIDYNYRILTVEYVPNNLVLAKLFDLNGQNIKEKRVNMDILTSSLIQLLQSKEALIPLKFIVERLEEDLLQEV